jgi:hypothetical protein
MPAPRSIETAIDNTESSLNLGQPFVTHAIATPIMRVSQLLWKNRPVEDWGKFGRRSRRQRYTRACSTTATCSSAVLEAGELDLMRRNNNQLRNFRFAPCTGRIRQHNAECCRWA